MKKANKAVARDWQQQERERERLTKQLEDETSLLWYAARKRKVGFPSAQAFRECGRDDVATEIDNAYSALGRAYALLRTT